MPSTAPPDRAARRRGPRLLTLSRRLGVLVAAVAAVGIAGGVAGLLFGYSDDLVGMIAVTALVGVGQSLALEVEEGSISVGAVGAIAAAALFDFRVALAIAVVSAIVDWSACRQPLHRVLFNVGTLSLAGLAAAGVCEAAAPSRWARRRVVAGVGRPPRLLRGEHGAAQRRAGARGPGEPAAGLAGALPRLLPHYAAFGFLAGVIAIAYGAVGRPRPSAWPFCRCC